MFLYDNIMCKACISLCNDVHNELIMIPHTVAGEIQGLQILKFLLIFVDFCLKTLSLNVVLKSQE